MNRYGYHRNTSVMHAGAHIEAIRQVGNDERRAAWSVKYNVRGFHRGNGKPRIRVRDGQVVHVTVPAPLREPAAHAAPSAAMTPNRAPGAAQAPGNSLPTGPGQVTASRGERAGRQSIHASPCTCGDDAQRHYALIARDLMAVGRHGELTDDMRQAYDYEFGDVPEPDPLQVPEF